MSTELTTGQSPTQDVVVNRQGEVTRRFRNNQYYNFGGWPIAITKSSILPSSCYCYHLNKDLTDSCIVESSDLQANCSGNGSLGGENKSQPDVCHVCRYNSKLSITHQPELIFPDNLHLLTFGESNLTVESNAFDGLKLISPEYVHGTFADEWKPAQIMNVGPLPGEIRYDWSFSTNYKGTVTSQSLESWPAYCMQKQLNMVKLQQRENILFSEELSLRKDQLHNHRTSNLSVKIDLGYTPLCKKASVFKRAKQDTSFLIEDFPDDLAAGLALQKLDFAISSLIKIDKIVRKIRKADTERRYRHRGSWTATICKGLIILFLAKLVLSVPMFEAEGDKRCSSQLDCADCITNGCIYVEFANKSRNCVATSEVVHGLRRRQFSKKCPDDLLPKEIGKWLENRTEFIEQELFGYKLYLWITIPIIVIFVAFLGFRLYKCYYHKTRYQARRNYVVPECLRMCCNRNRAIPRESSIDLEEVVHYDTVSQYSEASNESNSTSFGSNYSVTPTRSTHEYDSTYVPSVDSSASHISENNTIRSAAMILRPRKQINYKD